MTASRVSEIITVGRFGAPFGVQGWIHCQSYTTPLDNMLRYQPWFYQDQQQNWQPLQDVSTRRHKKAYIAKLPSHETREDVAQLRGLYIGVEASSLPEPQSGEVYWHDLVGCAVHNTEGPLGSVTSIMETGANDVLVVQGTEQEILIPYTDGYVRELDLTARMILVDWHLDWS